MSEPHETYAAAAVAWALARVGQRTTPGRCLAFVEDAYERANAIEVFGGSSAAESASAYGTRPYDAATPPPAGSFVFFACGGPIGGVTREWGHVGLAVGDGRVVHALDEVRVDDAPAIEAMSMGSGWSSPRLIGWTGSERILEGHRPRDWDQAASGG
jgi:cell wall-associated NlpC family hydrolase